MAGIPPLQGHLCMPRGWAPPPKLLTWDQLPLRRPQAPLYPKANDPRGRGFGRSVFSQIFSNPERAVRAAQDLHPTISAVSGTSDRKVHAT